MCTILQYVAVVVIPDSLVAFDNNQEPAAYVEIMSIGHLGEKENVIISEAVFQLLAKLGVKDTRYLFVYIYGTHHSFSMLQGICVFQ